MKFITLIAGILALLIGPSLAWLPKSASYPARLNSAQVNINPPAEDTISTQYFMNAIKAATQFTFAGGSDPSVLDANGYPNGTLVGSLTFNIIFPNETTGPGTQWVFKWPATRTIAGFTFGNQFQNVINSTPSGCTVAASTVTGVAGQACRFVFNFLNLPGNQAFTFSAGAYGGTGDLVLVRLQDEGTYDAGGDNSYFQPEFIKLLKNLGPATTRMMPSINGIVSSYTNLSRWNYRNTPSYFSWRSRTLPPAVWGGTISGTDTYTVSAPTDAPVQLTNGQVVQGNITNGQNTAIKVSGAQSNGGNVQLTLSTTAPLSPGQVVWPVTTLGTTEANGQTTILTVDDGYNVTINVPFVRAFQGALSHTVTIGGDTTTFTNTSGGTNFGNGNQVTFTTSSATFTGVALKTAYYVTGAAGANFQLSLTCALLSLNNTCSNGGTAISGVSGGVGTQTLMSANNAGGGTFGFQNLTVGSYAQKPICNPGSAPPAAQFLPVVVSGVATFTYDVQLNCWAYQTGGIVASTPIEAMTAQANLSGAAIWYNIPNLADDDFVTKTATYARDHMKPDFLTEYSNEIWNGAFPQTLWVTAKGSALGFPSSSNEDQYSFYALRVRQISGIIKSLWTANGRALNTYHMILSNQTASGYGGPPSSVTNFRWEGTALVGATFPLYCAYVGGTFGAGVCTGDPGYNVAGNRPIDFTDIIAYANYINGSWSDVNTSYGGGSNIPFFQAIANAWGSGDQATALALIDNDMNFGLSLPSVQTVTIGGDTKTFTASGAGFSCNVNLNAHGALIVFTTTGTTFTGVSLNTPYWVIGCVSNTFQISLTSSGSAISGISGGTGTQSAGLVNPTSSVTLVRAYEIPFETAVASYDAFRAGQGLAPIDIHGYEGGNATAAPVAPPTGGGCVSMSISTADCTSISNALTAWKSGPVGQANYANVMFPVYRGQNSNFIGFGVLPHHKIPSQFIFSGSPVYGTVPGDVFSAPFAGVFYGIRQWQWGITQP